MKHKLYFLPYILLFIFSAKIFPQEATPLPAPIEKKVEKKVEKKKKTPEYLKVNGLENWYYNYDISDYPDGEYNLLIRSTDKAGNVSVAGPINIFIDSKSDLPSVSISSPVENMRVGGDFTIIGTASDDDAVDYVEVQLDDGPFTRAEGKEFWSLSVKLKSVPDGVHTITARSTDINGLGSEEVSVKFNLDKTKPEITVTSHNNGEILSKQVTLKGKVYDANGVESLVYSLDGKKYKSLKLTGKKENEERKFSLKIDTRNNEEGTKYIWFKSKDGMGSEGSATFVYYSDNKKPVITIKSPAEHDILNGFVTVSGTVYDEVGLKSFSYSLDKKEVPVPLVAGNPFWSHTFDLRGRKTASITFTAVDLTGNTKKYTLKLKLNNVVDMPLIELIGADKESYIHNISEGEGYLKGFARDDDGVKSVEYSIDKSDYKSIDSNGPFLIPIKGLEPGKHTIEIRAVDNFNLKGKSRRYGFYILNKEPEIFLDTYTSDKIKDEPFKAGVIFRQGKTATISGHITGGEKALSVSYTIGNMEEKTVRESNGKFTIPLPKELDAGGHNINLSVTDRIGRQAKFTSRIYFSPPPKKGDKYKPVKMEKEDGVFIEDSRLGQMPAANISEKNPLTGYITGYRVTRKIVEPAVVDKENPKKSKEAVIDTIFTSDTIKSAVLEPSQESFKVVLDGSRFSIVPLSDSVPVSFRVRVKTEFGKEYVTKELHVGSDSTKPQLNVRDAANEVVTDTLRILGTYSDTTSVKRASVEFFGTDGLVGSKRELKNEKNDAPGTFNMDVDLLSIDEGYHFYTVTVTDIFGNSVSETLPFVIDRTPAKLSIVQPEADVPVNGLTTVTGKIEDFENGGELFFSDNGKDFVEIPLSGDNVFSRNVDFSNETLNPDNLVFKVSDRGGNITEFNPRFKVDREADRPTVSIEIPSENETVRGDFKVSGLVFDDDGIGSIFYSLDGGDFVEIKGDKYFSIPFSLNSLNDGKHTVTVRAADSGGFMSKEAKVTFVVSKSEPVSTLVSPGIEYYARGDVLLKGSSYDENGIASVAISYDNGITYNEAVLKKENGKEGQSEGNPATVNWVYNLDTRLPGDGTKSILIKAFDSAGTMGLSSTILNIDNTVPELKLDYPGENESVAGSLVIDGKVFDVTGVKTVTAEIKPLGGNGKTLTREIKSENVFRETIDLKDFGKGWYNLTLTVTDFAENITSETRNFKIVPMDKYKSVDIYFPEEGKSVVGNFVVEGRMINMDAAGKAILKIDGKIYSTADVNDYGLFRFSLGKGDLTDGSHIVSVESNDAETKVVSGSRNIYYISQGPWLRVENITSGQFVSGRPMVKGTAGYSGLNSDDKSKRVKRVEVSLDNGKSFTVAKGRENWQFRLETIDMPEGVNQLIVRSFLEDGQSCVTKLFVNVDENPPKVNLVSPEENKRFNGLVPVVGTAGDENGLRSVEVLIREGKKEKYQVPSFVQGLYIDMHALGATYGEVGAGLSFFDDVVKLQVQIGIAPPGRFSGLVIGGKLLANILNVPFSYFFGHDWDFFSMSLAVGADFNYFTMSDNSIKFTDKGVVLGSVLAQYEFAKFYFKDLKMFNRYSLYMEGSLWFISSDVQAGIVPRYSLGARIGIF